MKWLWLLYSLILTGLWITQSTPAIADSANIFEVRKNLKLSNDEPDFKDYYIGAGNKNGLKKGMVVDVIRKMPLHDNLINQSQGDLVMTIAQVKLIHVQGNISVARLFKGSSATERPVANFRSIMVGDEINLKSARFVKRKAAAKKAVVKKITPKVTASIQPSTTETSVMPSVLRLNGAVEAEVLAPVPTSQFAEPSQKNEKRKPAKSENKVKNSQKKPVSIDGELMSQVVPEFLRR